MEFSKRAVMAVKSAQLSLAAFLADFESGQLNGPLLDSAAFNISCAQSLVTAEILLSADPDLFASVSSFRNLRLGLQLPARVFTWVAKSAVSEFNKEPEPLGPSWEAGWTPFTSAPQSSGASSMSSGAYASSVPEDRC